MLKEFKAFIMRPSIPELATAFIMATPKKQEAATMKAHEFCKTDIAIDATRCPNCTSQLSAASA